MCKIKYYLDIWTWWYIKIWKWKWPHKHKYECNLIVCICILVILGYPWKKCPFMLETSPETLLYYLQISTYYTTTRSWMRRHLMPVLLWTRTITVWCHKKRLWKVFEKEKKVIYIKKVMAENPVIIENVVFDCKRWVSYLVRHFPPKWLKSYTSLIKDLRQNIKRVSSFCNDWWYTFPQRNCSDNVHQDICALTQMRRITDTNNLFWDNIPKP